MRAFRAVTAAVALGALAGLPARAAVTASGAGSASTGAGRGTQAIEIGEIPECTQLVPAAIALPGATSPITLSLHVLLDGVSAARAAEVVARAAAAYQPLGLTLAATYAPASFGTADATDVIEAARAQLGGQRPAGVDAVLVVTAQDLEDAGDTAVAGMADCIGGVAHADRSFAVVEVRPGPETAIFGYEISAKVFAHELGHLLGGHHHYANCVEGLAASDLDGDLVSPCSLMFNVVEPTSLHFGTVNGLVVRGHAEAYAAP